MNPVLVMLAAAVLAGSADPTAGSLAQSFPVGQGSRFQLQYGNGLPMELVIIVTEAQGRRLGVEYYIAAQQGPMPVEMWQQFILEIPEKGPLKIVAGYLEHPDLKDVERMPDSALQDQEHLGLEDFLIPSSSPRGVTELGEETVTVPAGTLKARHLMKADGKVHFWVSDQARPMGLVKLVSHEARLGANYTIELVSLVKNARSRIDPTKARPASAQTRSILSTTLRKSLPF